jgi:hypothetical protein
MLGRALHLVRDPRPHWLRFMRWKLLIAASLLATIVGAGSVLALVHFVLAPAGRVADPGWVAAATLLLPLAAITFATIFVYRHTARRRTLQAAATALLAIILTLAALLTIPPFLVPRPVPPSELQPIPNS